MTNKHVAGIALLVAGIVMLALVMFFRPSSNPVVDTASSTNASATTTHSTAQNTSSSNPPKNSVAQASTNTKVETRNTPRPSEPTPEPTAVPLEDKSPAYKEYLDEHINDPYLDDIFIIQLIEEIGVEETYKRLKPEHRFDMIEYFQHEDKLRDNLAFLLEQETDSELRAFMLERTDPKYLFEETEGDSTEDPIDTELVDLLNAPTNSEISDREWLVRLDLAMLTDAQLASELARESWEKYPDNVEVRFQAAETMLKLAQSLDSVSPIERARAEEILYQELSDPGQYEIINADLRIRGLHALYFATDKDRSRRFFQDQLERETDPRVRKVIETLLNH